MLVDFLEQYGLSKRILKDLSYESQLGKSLKNTLHKFNKNEVLQEIDNIHHWYDQQEILDDLALDSRIKSVGSAEIKWDRYYPDMNFRRVFNDILGFRIVCDSYYEVLSCSDDDFRIVDMSQGKNNDDGYRGVHVYYQLDNRHYPIEIQINTYFDRQFNNWMHTYFYKQGYDNRIGQKLRSLYESGRIRSVNDFKEVLDHVLSARKEI